MKNSQTSSGWLSLRFWGISFGFWFAYALLTMSARFVDYFRGIDSSWAPLFPGSMTLVLYWLVTPPLFEYVHRLGHAGLRSGQYYFRLFLAAFAPSAVSTALFMLYWGAYEEGFWPYLAQSMSVSVAWIAHYTGVVGVAVAINQFRMAQTRKQEVLAAELRALRSQLQPHFLFNSLQAIAVTIRRDSSAAISMVTLLGDLLRQTLRERNGELVSLQEEQELLLPYLELQRLRFADRLEVEIDMPAEVLGAAVPDLILQPLVENALQHGIESMPGKGSVRIRARRSGEFLEIEVADDGAGPDREEITDGIGLGATRARLHALFGDRSQLTLLPGGISGAVVTVRMPWQEVSGVA